MPLAHAYILNAKAAPISISILKIGQMSERIVAQLCISPRLNGVSAHCLGSPSCNVTVAVHSHQQMLFQSQTQEKKCVINQLCPAPESRQKNN